MDNITPFTRKVETLHQFWPTPGAYLRRSMLSALARNISGVDLPESLVQDRTFDDNDYPLAAEPTVSMSRTASMVAACDIERAIIASIKNDSSDGDTNSCSVTDEDGDGALVSQDGMERL